MMLIKFYPAYWSLKVYNSNIIQYPDLESEYGDFLLSSKHITKWN